MFPSAITNMASEDKRFLEEAFCTLIITQTIIGLS